MKKAYQIAGALMALALLGAGCGQGGAATTTADTAPLKIGYIGPLTGQVAEIGNNTLTGALVARDEINTSGGISGRKIELVVEDTLCDAKAAVAAGQKLIESDKVAAIIGGTCSSETLALAPVAEAARVPLISPGATSPKVTDAGDYTFRFVPSDSFQGKYAAEYAVQTLGKHSLAILHCESDYCRGLETEFKNRALALGASIVADEQVRDEDKDAKTQLEKIKQAKPELIFFPAYPDAAAVGMRQMKELGIAVPVLGGDAWTDTGVGEAVKKSGADASYLVAANKTLPDSFTGAMKGYLHSDSIIYSAPRAYDIVYALKDIIGRVGTDGGKIKDELYKLNKYEGIADSYTMDRNGDLAGAKFEVKKW